MIIFKQVNKTYKNQRHVAQHAIRNLNFHIREGEMVFIKGHSGAGKSTLLKLIARIESVSNGEILVKKTNINQLSNQQIPYYRRQFGIIFQDPMLLNNYSAYDNVALPLIISGFNHADIPKRVKTALNRVGLLEKTSAFPYMLSSGEQQRLSIARAIVHKPTILLADEPTGNLDPVLSAEIMNLFVRFNQAGVTTLIATHDQTLLSTLLTGSPVRTLTLNQGHLIHEEN